MRLLRRKLRRDLRRQWPQFVALIVTIMLGVAMYAAGNDAYRNLQASYGQAFVDLRFADLWVTGGDVQAFAQQADGVDGVAVVETRIQADVPIRVGPDKLRGRIVSIPLGGQPAVNQAEIDAGTYPASTGQVLAERHMYNHFDLAPGAAVEVLGADGWVPLEVSGSAFSAEYLWPARSRQEIVTLPDDFGVLFVPHETAAMLAGTTANQAVVRLADDADRPVVLTRLRELAAEVGAIDVYDRDEQPSNSLLNEDIEGFEQMSVAFPLLFLGAAGMATYVLITRRVQSEREIIGMLLASGMRKGAVLRHYLGYGVAAGAIGAVLGVILGMAFARALSRFYVGFIDLPRAVIELRPATLLTGLAYGVGLGAVAAAAPALLASRTSPATAMRGVVPATGGRYSLLERLVPPLRRLPARWRMIIRGIGRNRRRTAFTMIGVILSLLLILTSWSLIDTMNHLLDVQFDVVGRQDARVEFVAPGAGDLGALEAVDGVAQVEQSLAVPVAIRSDEASYATLLQAYQSGTEMHGFRAPSGQLRDLPTDGVLVGLALQDLLGIEVGDTVQIEVQGMPVSASMRVAGFVDEPLGTFAYASMDEVGSAFGAPIPATSALLRFEDGADRTAVRRAVNDLGFVAAYEDAQAFRDLYEDFTGLFYAFVGGMLVLGGLMAFAMIFTTMSVNIVERAREVATLRASGVRTRTISRLIASENLILVLLGIVPGLLAGVLGGRAMMGLYSTDQFRLELVVKPLTLVVAAGAILVVAAVSQWPSLRAVRRLDIATVVRERAA